MHLNVRREPMKLHCVVTADELEQDPHPLEAELLDPRLEVGAAKLELHKCRPLELKNPT